MKDTIGLLKEIPEYKQSTARGSGPKVIVGSEKRRAGKIFVDMRGEKFYKKVIYGRTGF